MSPGDAFRADSWLDRDDNTSSRKRGFPVAITTPLTQLARRVWRFAATSPGRLSLVTTFLVIALLVAGIANAISSNNRQDRLDALVTQQEPLTNAAQEIYTSLSIADAAITSAFLLKSATTTPVETQFNSAVLRVNDSLVRASNGISNIESREMELVVNIQAQMPEYLHLISSAQANDRQRNPIGASYLTQASSLMRERLLPAAEELHTLTSLRLSEEQDRLIRPPFIPQSGLIAALIFLILAQFWLAAKTNRRLNIGWLAATVLVVLATIWSVGTSGFNWYVGQHLQETTVRPLEQLNNVRITVQQARTEEALGLIQRNYGEDAQAIFTDSISAIDKTLEDIRSDVLHPASIDNAREALRLWDKSHAAMVIQIREGNYSQAILEAFGGEDAQSVASTSFAILDADLQNLISSARTELQQALIQERVTAVTTTNILAILIVLAAIAVAYGSRPRIQEYV